MRGNMFENMMKMDRENGTGVGTQVCLSVRKADRNDTLQYMWAVHWPVHTLAQCSQEQHQSREI